jgi:hypothetical protein
MTNERKLCQLDSGKQKPCMYCIGEEPGMEYEVCLHHRVEFFVDDNFRDYKSWLSEYIGYAGGMDWDSPETRLAFYYECKDEHGMVVSDE